MATLKIRADELTGRTGLSVFLYGPGQSLANSGGDTLSESDGLFTATVNESLAGLYDYYIKKSGRSIYRGTVYCEGSTWIADQPPPTIYPPAEKEVTDSGPLEFQWNVLGATFSNSSNTCKKRFTGQSGIQAQPLSGTIVAIAGKPKWYRLNYNLNDRAQNGIKIIPTEVCYTLVDDLGNTEELTLRLVSARSDTIGGNSFEIQINDDHGNPIPHCVCWVTTDEAGTNTITDKWETNEFGKVNFVLVPGSYWLFRQKNGTTFITNPRSFTVV